MQKGRALIIFSVLVVTAYTLFVLNFPDKLDVKFAPKGGWDVDSGSYFGLTQAIVGEKGEESYFKEALHRPVYPALAALPYTLTHSKQAMLVPVFLTAVLLPYLLFLTLREYGISDETSLIMAVLLLFSRVFAFYGAVAMADIPSLFFGIFALLLWKKKDYLNSSLIMTIAILTREINLLFFGATVISDIFKKKFRKEVLLPIVIVILLVGSYAQFFVKAHTIYNQAQPEDVMEFNQRTIAIPTTVLATFGITTLFALLGYKKSSEMSIILFGNAALQLAWQSVHKRFWLPSFLPILYFGARWLDKRNKLEKLLITGFILLADASYSVIPGAIAAIL